MANFEPIRWRYTHFIHHGNTYSTENPFDHEIEYGNDLKETPKRLRQTLGRYRDYDPGTDELNQGGGAPQPPYRDDSGLTGGVVDIYGIRRSADPKDISRVKPSQLVGEMRGAQNQKVSKEAQEIIKRSLKVSEDMRRARIEGRR